jgi:eukaryotic-like serine/threonine-protein kinase
LVGLGGMTRAPPPRMAGFRSSFYDEVETHDLVSFEDVPTNLQHDRRDRTVIELDDPEPTMPPDASRMTPLPRLSTPPTPMKVERYALERLIGCGAFGRVFEARDIKLGRSVAVKVLHPEHAQHHEIRERFIQEAHVTACISHPGIVTVYDAGEFEGSNRTAYIAMELLAGESLYHRATRGGRMACETVRELGRQIASTLHAAHRAGVIHRDLKPENIFLVPDPAAASGERVKVLDFGLAKPTLRASFKTKAATVFGTPAYMSPEQCESTRNIDPRSDIYSLGCILFQLVTGRAPFEGTMRELLTHHRTTPAPRLRSIVPDACPELDALVAAMLAKDPAARPQSMVEVEHVLGGKPVAMPATPVTAAPSSPPRTAGKVGLALLAVAAVLGFCLSCGAV